MHTAEHHRVLAGTAVEEVAVSLPGHAHAAVGLDVLLGRQAESIGRGDARGGGDTVDGGHGNDTLIGGDGIDTVLGELKHCPGCELKPGMPVALLLRPDDVQHDDDAVLKAEVVKKAFRGAEFLYTLRLASGEKLLAHVPSHHDHQIGEWIGIRPEVDHVVTFQRGGD